MNSVRKQSLRKSDIARRNERVARGMCGYCGTDPIAQGSKSRCRACLDYVNASNQRNPNRTPDVALMRSIRHKTGLSLDAIRSVWAGRYQCCAICSVEAKDTQNRVLDFDHDHATGAFRGWLCRRCNMAVGFFESLGIHVPNVVSYLGPRGKPQEAPAAAHLHLVRSA